MIVKKYDLTDPDLRDIGWKPYHVSVFFYFYPKQRHLFELEFIENNKIKLFKNGICIFDNHCSISCLKPIMLLHGIKI